MIFLCSSGAVLGLPLDFQTEHSLLTLHLWILHCRFSADYDAKGEFSGRRMQQEVFERFWEDTTLRIRNLGVEELTLNKHLENAQKLSFYQMEGYDNGLVITDDDNMTLSAALFR